jgi:hypothetical protein
VGAVYRVGTNCGMGEAMSAWLVAFVGLIYLAVAVEQAYKGSWSMCIVFVGYALANAGMLVAVR